MSDDLVEKVISLDINRTACSADLTPANGGLDVSQKLPTENIRGLHSPRKRTLSPIRSIHNRSLSPGKHASRQRERSFTQSPERSFILSKSPDRSRIWSQWDLPDNKKQCLQDYNIRQMEWLYGKPLTGHVETALMSFRQKAVMSASVPVSYTPRGAQTERSASGVNDQEYKRYVGSPYKNTEMKAREMLKAEKNLNKLSTRHRVQRTPGVNEIRAREQQFTNDAIITERRRTRFKDVIPQYDASSDKHCKAYFKRRDVQSLLSVTCSRDNTPAGSVTPGQTPAGFTPRPTPGATPW